MAQFIVADYPTILLLKDNQSYIYTGEMVPENIVEFEPAGNPGFVLTGPKTFAFKLWFIPIIDLLLLLMDEIGLAFLPYWPKALIPITLLASPVIALAIYITLAVLRPEKQKEQAPQKREKAE